jgi:hypothetical protein
MAAIEAPSMIARILLIGKLSAAALPFQTYFVFGHCLYMECAQALGKRLLFSGCNVGWPDCDRVSLSQLCEVHERESDNHCEQSHRGYPDDQERQCCHVVVEPMYVHAHENRAPLRNERAPPMQSLKAKEKAKETLNFLLHPCHTRT